MTAGVVPSAPLTPVPTQGVDTGFLRRLLLEMGQQQSLGALLDVLVNRMAESERVGLVRVWLLEPADICGECPMADGCEDKLVCLHLVASAGRALKKRPPGQTDVLHGDFRRIPLGVGPGKAAVSSEVTVVRDVQTDPEWAAIVEWSEAENIHGSAVFPMIFRGVVVGVIHVMLHVPAQDGAGREWLRIYADAIAAAVVNVRMREANKELSQRLEVDNAALRKAVAQAHAFASVAVDLTGSLTAEDRFRRFLSILRGVIPADACALWRIEGDTLIPSASEGVGPRFLDGSVPIDDRAFRRFVDSGDPVRLSGDALPALSFYPSRTNDLPDTPVGVLTGAALRIDGEVVGLLTMSARDRHAFDAISDDTIGGFAALAAAAIRTANLIGALETRAERGEAVADLLQRAAEQLVVGPLLGESPAIQQVDAAIAEAARHEEPVLVVGPAGAGKEAVASAIHQRSARAGQPFIRVGGGDLSDSGDGLTLFGSLDADGCPSYDPDSRFGLAAGGTLYVHGVTDLSTSQQQVLATVLAKAGKACDMEGCSAADVRVIASAWRDPLEELQAGRFDTGLYRALARHAISVPPLHQRRSDVPVLARHYATLHARRLGKVVTGLTDESIHRLQEHLWPGNVHELENVIERVVIAARTPVLEVDEALLDAGVPMGRYRLIDRLGAGGMGEVWRARHQLLARPAAVKLIRHERLGREGSEGARVTRRFEREAQATAGLRSPHTVQLYDFGVNERGVFYYVMELLQGMDLETMVTRFGPLPASRVVHLLAQACHSLMEAHEAGLVHRDIKPANLHVGRIGPDHDVLKVLDFGMVRKAELDGTETRLSMDGAAQGTPAYMAPEVALGEADLDPRLDLYALGCVAFWLLTGQLVFEADTPLRMMMKHVSGVPARPSELSELDIPEALEDLIMECLAKTPGERPESARALRDALLALPVDDPWTETRAACWWADHAPELVSP